MAEKLERRAKCQVVFRLPTMSTLPFIHSLFLVPQWAKHRRGKTTTDKVSESVD